ncbi:unnamed protein product [Rotaria sp. Silwood1]|nr:unnamed protein product [Rotaria sp. Silwood1]
MNYFLYYDYLEPDNKEIEIHKLATLGRIVLRYNKLVDAEKFLLNAYDFKLPDLTSVAEKLEARLTLVYQGTLNDESNKIMADIERRLALHFIKADENSRAIHWF